MSSFMEIIVRLCYPMKNLLIIIILFQVKKITSGEYSVMGKFLLHNHQRKCPFSHSVPQDVITVSTQ